MRIGGNEKPLYTKTFEIGFPQPQDHILHF